jgi:ribosomal protein L29
MKKKIKDELKSKTSEELFQEVEKRKLELMVFKMNINSGKNKNTSACRFKRDELTLIKTILKERSFSKEKTK